MFDAALRRRLDGPLADIAAVLHGMGVRANWVTVGGLAVGAGACVAVAFEVWWLGLALWVVNRAADGIDGPLARHDGSSDFGGFLDIVSDFAVYGGLLVAIGVALPEARMVCLVVFLAYYLSGSAFLAFSSLATKRHVEGDGRSLRFPAGIAEGTETIVAMIVVLAWPTRAEVLLWIWAALVGITLLQRIRFVARLLAD